MSWRLSPGDVVMVSDSATVYTGPGAIDTAPCGEVHKDELVLVIARRPNVWSCCGEEVLVLTQGGALGFVYVHNLAVNIRNGT